MFAYVDHQGAPLDEFVVAERHPDSSGSWTVVGVVAAHPDGLAIGWQVCWARGSCSTRLQVFFDVGEQRSD